MEDTSQQQQSRLYRGVTSPLSLAGPTEDDLKETRYLEDMLIRMEVFESGEGMMLRSSTLLFLQTLACEWIREIALIKSIPSHVAETVGGKIFAFGSYRLGVNSRGADVDAVLVSPRFVERHEFFEQFPARLKEHPDCSELHAVSDAFVPVIKMTFRSVDIDLLFAKLDLPTIPDDIDLRANTETLLRNMDEQCVRSINGCRVTDEILHQVPNPENFRVALKVIRIWAKKRGIYSNAMGFLGGVSWAILLARIAQLYPNAAPNVLIMRFFYVLTRWDWPKPVELCELTPPNLHFPEWDPRTNLKDKYHLMPIITPVYPRQNSTYNVSHSTKQVILDELERGRQITSDILFKRKTWEDLLQSKNFFESYKHFVIVIASSDTAELHLDFHGLVESQLRKLVLSFEQNGAIARAHVNTKSYGRSSDSDPQHVSKWIIGIMFRKIADAGKKLNVDLTYDISNFIKQINSMTASSQLHLNVEYSRPKGLMQFLPKSEHPLLIRKHASKAGGADKQSAQQSKPPQPSRQSSAQAAASGDDSPSSSSAQAQSKRPHSPTAVVSAVDAANSASVESAATTDSVGPDGDTDVGAQAAKRPALSLDAEAS
uniref:Poly(A) polymerase n=1 Tax=Macrostomum lignano TaxID=282301 RepID=A0A1I8JJM1_9PLAT